MSQSKRSSLLEALTNTAVGFCINVVVNLLLMGAYGFRLTWGQSAQMTVIFTIISILRGYVLRRIFNRALRKNA